MTLFEERLQGLAEDVVTAAVWDPLLHPRARNGQFIKVGGFVRGLFRIGNGSEQKLNGQVLEVRANKRDPKDPLIKVKTKHGDLITPASRISEATKPKGFLSKLPWAPPTPEEQAYLDRPLDGDVAFVTGVPMEGRDLNGIPLGELDFDPHTVADVDVGEPPMPDVKKSQSAGVLITEEDGRVWLYEPANHFGGYSTTISKGRVEKGDTVQQAALREAYEELGLVAEITGYLGDYEGSVTNTRLYTGKRVGGAPWSHDFESAEVRLVTPETAATLFNTERDQMILADLTGNTAPLEAWREAHPPPPPKGYDWLKELEDKYGKGNVDWKGHKPPAKWEPKGKGKPLFDPGPTQIAKQKAKDIKVSEVFFGPKSGKVVFEARVGWQEAGTLDGVLDGDTFKVRYLHVEPGSQRQGVATALMDNLTRWADERGVAIDHGDRTAEGAAWWDEYNKDKAKAETLALTMKYGTKQLGGSKPPLSPIPPSAEPASWKADLESTVQVMSNEGTPLQLEVFNTYEDDGEFVGDISATLANGQEAGFISYSGDEEGVFLDEWETDPEQDEEDVLDAMKDWLKSIGVPLIEQTDIVAEQDTQADLLERTTTAGAARRVIGQVWDELLHPRGKDGRFIDKGGFVRGMFTLPDGTRENMRAEVIAYAPNVGNPDDPIIQVKTADGGKAVALASQVSAVPMTKAELNVSAAQFQLDYFEAKQHFHDVLEGKSIGDLLPSELMEDLKTTDDPPKLGPDIPVEWAFGQAAVGQTFSHGILEKGVTKAEMEKLIDSFNGTFGEWTPSKPVPYKDVEAWFNDNAPELLGHFDSVITGTGFGLPSDYMYEVEAASTAVGAVLDKEITRRTNVIEGVRLLSVDEFTEQSKEVLEEIDVLKAQMKTTSGPSHKVLEERYFAAKERLKEIDANRHTYQTAYAKQAKEVLAEVTPGGLGGELKVKAFKQTPEQEAAMHDIVALTAGSVYPSWWIEASNEHSVPVSVALDPMRSYYNPAEGHVILPPKFDNYAQQTFVHEFGHRMEHVVPGLRPLEYSFYWRRMGKTFEPKISMNKAKGGGGFGANEFTRPDEFSNAYMGKDYGVQPDSFYEIFTMGAEQILTPEIQRGKGSPKLIASDADYRAFILGAVVNVEKPVGKKKVPGPSADPGMEVQAEVQDVQFKALLSNGIVANVKRIERDDDGNMFLITTINERVPAAKVIKTYQPGTPDGNKDKEKKAVELLPWKNNLNADVAPVAQIVDVPGRDPQTVAATKDGEVVGFLSWRPAGYASEKDPPLISLVWVAPEHREQGIADDLVTRALLEEPGLTHSANRSDDAEQWSMGTGLPRQERYYEESARTPEQQGQDAARDVANRLGLRVATQTQLLERTADPSVREFGEYTLRYDTMDEGERKPRHIITAYLGDQKVGELNWYGTTGTIHNVDVDEEHARQGLATAMWEWGQELPKKPKHSADRTTQGDAWARAMGGRLPRKGN